MKWNIAGECVSLIILGVIWIYSRKGAVLPTLKNKIFQCCFLVTSIAMFTNIISTIMLDYHTTIPLWLIWADTTIYFIFTPLMGVLYYLYSVSVAYEDHPLEKIMFYSGTILGSVYILFVLGNIYTKHLFDITLSEGYTKGPYIVVTYIIFYIYCFASLVLVIIRKKFLSKLSFYCLSSFPLIAVVVIIIQQIYPSVILSGSAATAALLIIYLYLQNKQITLDYLTELPTRQVLLKTLELNMKRNSTTPYALLLFSLRNFKDVNSKYQQHVGDLLLKAIADFLTTASSEARVFRYKGDEFAILLPDNKKESLEHIIHSIDRRMSSPWKVSNYNSRLFYVIGIASYPNTTEVLEDVINALEFAVIRAKSSKENHVCFCDKDMFAELQRKETIIQILQDRIERKEIELFYQPIYEISSTQFHYAESLMRITESPLGPLSPGEFIPIAEETGQIIEMTYLILDEACKFVKKILSNGIDIRAIHVNFSALQFKQEGLSQRVCDIIKSNDIPFSSIKIEFTETTLAESTKSVFDFASAMLDNGTRIGLDDFGIGYSNIATVIQLPFSTIKLDKSLIWAAMENERSSTAITQLIQIFKRLGMTVIAEGVETESQKEFVSQNEVDQIQGFYYSKPLPAHDAYAFFKTHLS